MSLFDLEPETLHPDRLDNPAERIYFDKWRSENKRRPGINSGYTTLEHILCPSRRRSPEPVSARDSEVAASLVQWLGTNCGRSFTEECERLISDENGTMNWLRSHRRWCEDEIELPVHLARIAAAIAQRFQSTVHWDGLKLADAVRTAMTEAYEAGRKDRFRQPVVNCQPSRHILIASRD